MLRNLKFSICLLLSSGVVYAQNNTFPATGNVGVGTGTSQSSITANIDVKSATQTTAKIKVRTADEDPSWGISIGQNPDLSGFVNAGGRDLTVSSGWSNKLILGDEHFTQYNGKVLVPGGRFGIGTTTPLVTFHVDGESLLGKSSSTWTYFNSLTGGRIRGSGEGYLWLESSPDGTGDKNMYFRANGTGRFEFRSSSAILAVIANDGKMGIGTASPDAKLTVKGNIHAEEVKVDLSVPGPDYVFEKNYNMMSLSDLKKYIEDNKHLPEVPSATEMKEQGVNLSEMNILLLKKVEELTLHLIAQQEEIEKLKKSRKKGK